MQLYLDTLVSDRFHSVKCRYKETISDNQFLAILVGHFEQCTQTQQLLEGSQSVSALTHHDHMKCSASALLASQLCSQPGSGDLSASYSPDTPPGPLTMVDDTASNRNSPSPKCDQKLSDQQMAAGDQSNDQEHVSSGTPSPHSLSNYPPTSTPQHAVSNSPHHGTSSNHSSAHDGQSPIKDSADQQSQENHRNQHNEDQDDRAESPQSHLEMESQSPKILHCPVCTMPFHDKDQYNKHIDSHVSGSLYPFACQLCEAKFPNHPTLLGHIFTCHADHPELRHFQSRALYHENHRHRNEKMEVDDREEDDIGEEDGFPCHACSLTFDDRDTLEQHMREQHPLESMDDHSPQPPKLHGPLMSSDMGGDLALQLYRHLQSQQVGTNSNLRDANYRCACGLQFVWPEQIASHRASCVIATGQDFAMMEKDMIADETSRIQLPQQLLGGDEGPDSSTTSPQPQTSSAVNSTSSIPATSSSTNSSMGLVTAAGSALDLSVCKSFASDLQSLIAASGGVGSGRILVCPECKFMASSTPALYLHFETEHRGVEGGTFPCTCGTTFDRLPNFLRHYVNCPIAATDLQESAPPITSSPSRLGLPHNHPLLRYHPTSQHQSMTLPPPLTSLSDSKMLYACPRCGQQFTQQQEVGRHLAHCQHHFPPPPHRNERSSGDGSIKRERGISLPQSMGMSVGHLNNRSSSLLSFPCSGNPNGDSPAHHGSGAGPPRPFKCSYCIKCFKSKALLDQHMHIHYPPKYTCRFCGKKYRWPPVFYHHQRTCKKRPIPASGSALGSGGGGNTTLSGPKNSLSGGHLVNRHSPPLKLGHHRHHSQHIPSHHQNGLGGIGGIPPPPLGLPHHPTPPSPVSGPQGNPLMGPLTCLCGFKFDDLGSYVSHVNSCQVLLARLGAPRVTPTSHQPALHSHHMLPPTHLLPPGHPASLFSTSMAQQHSHHQQQQNTAAMMAAVAAAMSQQQQQVGIPTLSLATSGHYTNTITSQSLPSPSAVTLPRTPSGGTHRPPSVASSPRLESPHHLKTPNGSLNISLASSNDPGMMLGSMVPGSGGCNLCEQCGKEFSSRLSLKQHVEGKHSAEGKYQCPGCGKRYRWGASYYYHKKSCPAAKDLPNSDLKSPTVMGLMSGPTMGPTGLSHSLFHPDLSWGHREHDLLKMSGESPRGHLIPPLAPLGAGGMVTSSQLQAHLQALATSCSK